MYLYVKMRYCKGATARKETSTVIIGLGSNQGVVSWLR